MDHEATYGICGALCLMKGTRCIVMRTSPACGGASDKQLDWTCLLCKPARRTRVPALSETFPPRRPLTSRAGACSRPVTPNLSSCSDVLQNICSQGHKQLRLLQKLRVRADFDTAPFALLHEHQDNLALRGVTRHWSSSSCHLRSLAQACPSLWRALAMAKNKVVAYFYDEEIGYVSLATLNVGLELSQPSAAERMPAAPRGATAPDPDAC